MHQLQHRSTGRPSEYESYLHNMEEMRLNYGRLRRGDAVYDPRTGRWRGGRPFEPRAHPGPMPIDLKAYVVAREYDPDKRTFAKIITELAKHKDELHPFMRRYLLERLRASENKHRQLAKRFGAVADQFEIDERPQSVSRDIATLGAHR